MNQVRHDTTRAAVDLPEGWEGTQPDTNVLVALPAQPASFGGFVPNIVMALTSPEDAPEAEGVGSLLFRCAPTANSSIAVSVGIGDAEELVQLVHRRQTAGAVLTLTCSAAATQWKTLSDQFDKTVASVRFGSEEGR